MTREKLKQKLLRLIANYDARPHESWIKTDDHTLMHASMVEPPEGDGYQEWSGSFADDILTELNDEHLIK